MKIKKGIYSKDERTKCKICDKTYEHLGSHVYHAHGIKANEYKEKYGMAHNLSLISPTVEGKKKARYEEHREKYLSNLYTHRALKNRYKVGDRSPNKYIGRRTRERNIVEIQKHNKNRTLENCPVCNKKYLALDSHLYNKHQLLRVKND